MAPWDRWRSSLKVIEGESGWRRFRTPIQDEKWPHNTYRAHAGAEEGDSEGIFGGAPKSPAFSRSPQSRRNSWLGVRLTHLAPIFGSRIFNSGFDGYRPKRIQRMKADTEGPRRLSKD